jgi:membrane protein
MKWIKKSRTWPRKIRGRIRLFVDASRKFNADHGFLLASAITFNFLICLIPIILLLLALIGQYLYSSREVLNHITSRLQDLIPSLDPQVMRSITRIIRHRKIAGVLGIGGLIWTSTIIFSSLRTVFNIVFHVDEGRGLFHGKALDLLMVLLAGISLLISMLLTSAVTFVQGVSFFPLLGMKPIFQVILKYLIPFFLTFSMSFVIYKIIPGKRVNLKAALEAAFFTSFFWETAKQLFGWYLSHLGRFSMVYGSLSTLAVFFFMVYYSSVILILGAEMAFLLGRKENPRFRNG